MADPKSIFILPKISLFTLAQQTKNMIVESISSKTGLSSESVSSRINVYASDTSASVIINNKGILIKEYSPTFDQTSVSRASVIADTSMIFGKKQIKRAFQNPKAGFIAKRKSKKAYPLYSVFGPSIATLFKQNKEEIMGQVIQQVEDQLRNG